MDEKDEQVGGIIQGVIVGKFLSFVQEPAGKGFRDPAGAQDMPVEIDGAELREQRGLMGEVLFRRVKFVPRIAEGIDDLIFFLFISPKMLAVSAILSQKYQSKK